jgi:uncharacterized protein
MVTKSTNQEEALPSSSQSAKAKKIAKPAKDKKPASPAKAAKAGKSSQSRKTQKAPPAKVAAPLTEGSVVKFLGSDQSVRSSCKKCDAPIATPTTHITSDVRALQLPVLVLEKPLPVPELILAIAPAEAVEECGQTAPRSENLHSEEANALYVLGIRYSTGRDVEQDLIAAHKWFNLATMMGHDDAKSCRADVASEMSKAQIAEAQRQARDWLRTRDARQSRDAEQAPAREPVKRPTYVRRRAQAIRSANSFARTCACA